MVSDPGHVLPWKTSQKHIQLCEQSGFKDKRMDLSIGKYLKILLEREVDGIQFQQTKKNMSEMVYSGLYNSNILETSIKQTLADQKVNLGKIMEVARIVRAILLNYISQTKGMFNVENPFSKSDIPIELSSLILGLCMAVFF